MRLVPTLLSLFLTATLAGCAGSVTGEVDGERPDAVRSGFWYWSYRGAGGASVAVVLSSLPNACATRSELLSRWVDAAQEATSSLDLSDLADTLDAIQKELLPPEYWETVLVFAADDEDELQGDGYEVGEDLWVTVSHQRDYIDWHDILDPGAWNVKTATGEGGTGEVSRFSDGGAAGGRAEVRLVDEDGDPAGEVAITFSVPYCEKYEEALDDAASADWLGF